MGALLSVGVWLARNLIKERLRQAIRYEYDERLERLKADLQREQSVQSVATASFIATHLSGHERRLAAIDELWRSVLRIRGEQPAAMLLAEILTPDEMTRVWENPKWVEALADLSLDRLMPSWANELERIRPFVGEYQWSLFYAYRMLVGRICVLFLEAKEGRGIFWRDDPAIKNLLQLLLDAEEIRRVQDGAFGNLFLVRQLIEEKILAEAGRVISGQASAETGLEQARQIIDAATRLRSKQNARASAGDSAGAPG